MADVTISDLPLKTELLDSDMVVVDSGTQSHRMYYAQFKTLFLQAFQEYFVDAAGDTMTGPLNVESTISATDLVSGKTADLTANSTTLASTAWVRSLLAQSQANGLCVFSKTGNGYIKFSNGIIIQWGLTTAIATNQSVTITLPTPFTSTNYRVAASPYTSAAGNGDKRDYWWMDGYTTTSFKVFASYEYASTARFSWIAIGY